jgi:nucleoside-diphosphate-sugar epimerase
LSPDVRGLSGVRLPNLLLNEGYDVIGIDRFSDYYPREIKERNLSLAKNHTLLTLLKEDIVEKRSS